MASFLFIIIILLHTLASPRLVLSVPSLPTACLLPYAFLLFLLIDPPFTASANGPSRQPDKLFRIPRL